jgi:hypothetical protein
MGHVLDKVTLGQAFLLVPRFSLVTFIPYRLHTHLHLHLALFLLFSVGMAETRLTHCSLPRLIALNSVLVPRSSPEAIHVERRERLLLAKGGIMGEKWPVKFSLTMRLPRHSMVL